MQVDDKLTIITPVRLGTTTDTINLIMSMTSLYVVMSQSRPKHLISPCDYRGLQVGRVSGAYKSALVNNYKSEYMKAKQCLTHYGANWTEIAPMSTPVQALVACLRETNTEYTYIHLADVGFINGKDVFSLCIKAMHGNPKLCQVRIGGYPLSNPKKNTDVIGRDGFNVYFTNDRQHPLEEYPVDNHDPAEDVVWSISMKAECQKNFFPVPLWNCVMRTSFLKKVVEQALLLTKVEPKTLTNLVTIINGAADLVEYAIPRTGWREEFKWIEELDHGILNMACYQYAWGREENSPDWFAKNNTIEVI